MDLTYTPAQERLRRDLGSGALRAAIDRRVVDEGLWPYEFMFALGIIVGGGTSQIQKSIIAERGLGMPRG